jgi:uncharacterized protein YkwD
MPKRQYQMSKPRTPEQLANLQSFTAPDTSGGTVPVTAKIDQADFDALEALPGDRSAKIRQAIRDYIAKHTNKPND